MSEPLLTILKICLLVLLYLFFFRVLRAVWVEVRSPVPAGVPAAPAPKESRRDRTRRERARRAGPYLLVVDPPDKKGQAYDLDDELTLGRAAGCRIIVDDTYVSQIHARVYQRDGQTMVEDLGSTNGTYLNRRRVTGAMMMQAGDRLQVGNTVLELQ